MLFSWSFMGSDYSNWGAFWHTWDPWIKQPNERLNVFSWHETTPEKYALSTMIYTKKRCKWHIILVRGVRPIKCNNVFKWLICCYGWWWTVPYVTAGGTLCRGWYVLVGGTLFYGRRYLMLWGWYLICSDGWNLILLGGSLYVVVGGTPCCAW